MKAIYLKDHQETVLNECLNRNKDDRYKIQTIKEAMKAQVNDNLRYKNGKTYCKEHGIGSQYVNKHEIPNYIDPAEAAKWEFTGYVMNSASRITRGYTAI